MGTPRPGSTRAWGSRPPAPRRTCGSRRSPRSSTSFAGLRGGGPRGSPACRPPSRWSRRNLAIRRPPAPSGPSARQGVARRAGEARAGRYAGAPGWEAPGAGARGGTAAAASMTMASTSDRRPERPIAIRYPLPADRGHSGSRLLARTLSGHSAVQDPESISVCRYRQDRCQAPIVVKT